MELVFAGYTEKAVTVQVAVNCPVCNEFSRLGVENWPYNKIVPFREIFVECECGMMFYPSVPDYRAEYFLKEYNSIIRSIFKSETKKGERTGGGANKKFRKKKAKFRKTYSRELFGT